MERPPQDPGRKTRPHLPPLEFTNQSVIQMVTVCVKGRRPILALDDVHRTLLNAWTMWPDWLIGRYAIMPDHIHLFCAPGSEPSTSLKKWVYAWRSEATRQWPRPREKPIWQKDFDDRQLRTRESYQQKWIYFWENPIKAGLIKRLEDWPFQGEMNVLSWHEPN